MSSIFPAAVSSATQDLAIEKLASSGISVELAEQLRLQVFDSAKDFSDELAKRPAIIFPYFYPDGSQVPYEIYWRARYLGTLPKDKPMRYRQPSGTSAWAYLPPILSLDKQHLSWAEFFKSDEALCVTEGEFKAIKACAAGLPTIAYGGVDNFSVYRSKGVDGVPPIAEGREFRNRHIRIVFDADQENGLKKEVYQAAQRLMLYVVERGGIPSILPLPFLDGKKTGLDDYLLVKTYDEFIQEVLPRAQPHDSATKILRFAQEWGYVRDTNLFVELKSKSGETLMVKEPHFEAATGHQQVMVKRLVKANAKDAPFMSKYALEPMPLGRALLNSELFPKYDTFVYRPGAPRTIRDNTGMYINMWVGWACEYQGEEKQVDLPDEKTRSRCLSLFHEYLDTIVGHEGSFRSWLEAWILFPLKYPGEQVNSFVLLWGSQGVGKTFMGEMLATYVYGNISGKPKHGYVMQPGELDRQFTPYTKGKTFILLEEIVTSASQKDIDNKLKALVTGRVHNVNLKNKGEFTLEASLLFWASSNSEIPIKVTQDARRPGIARVPDSAKDWPHFAEFSDLFKSGAAGATLLHYARESAEAAKLLNNFRPTEAPPNTRAKDAMTASCMFREEEWLRGIMTDAKDGLLTRTITSAVELADYHNNTGGNLREKDKAGANSMSRVLSRLGAEYLGDISIKVASKSGYYRCRAWRLVPGEGFREDFLTETGQFVEFKHRDLPEPKYTV